MGNKAAKQQIREGKRERARIGRQIENFSYTDPQFREGLVNPAIAAGVTNTAAGLTNPFQNNQVALQASRFQQQGFDQNLANILDQTIQGGGASAASATALARESGLAQQRIGAGIEQQELTLQQQQSQAEQRRQEQVAAGEARRQALVTQGESYLLQVAEARAGAELAGLGARYAGAQQTINQGYQAKTANNAAWLGFAGDVIGAGAQVGGALIGAAASDHRLKENIEFNRFSESGIPIYHFNYRHFPDKKFEGALSAGVPEDAVIKNFNGTKYDGIDYSKIDVDLKEIK